VRDCLACDRARAELWWLRRRAASLRLTPSWQASASDPNVELAQQGGLTVENGIRVDQFLRTSDPDINAAGDVANFPNAALGTRIRVEQEDNANSMGQHAGRNLAGVAAPYHHLPFFYSDLCELGYEAVGAWDVRHETVADWKEPFRKGVVYSLKHRDRDALDRYVQSLKSSRVPVSKRDNLQHTPRPTVFRVGDSSHLE
jgi:hypothetical protein